jgi:hypothetical protein
LAYLSDWLKPVEVTLQLYWLKPVVSTLRNKLA